MSKSCLLQTYDLRRGLVISQVSPNDVRLLNTFPPVKKIEKKHETWKISKKTHPLVACEVTLMFFFEGRNGEESVGLPQHQRLLCGGNEVQVRVYHGKSTCPFTPQPTTYPRNTTLFNPYKSEGGSLGGVG